MGDDVVTLDRIAPHEFGHRRLARAVVIDQRAQPPGGAEAIWQGMPSAFAVATSNSKTRGLMFAPREIIGPPPILKSPACRTRS